MAHTTKTQATPALSRPWLQRKAGQCAFPVSGDGIEVWSCCQPCGRATYCAPHARRMRGPRSPPVEALEQDIMALLEQTR